MASVFEQLDGEWRRLARDPHAAAQLADVCAAAAHARTLGEVERFVRACDPVDADRVLVALVARAVEGDVVAARVLLQLLLPGVRRLARTWWALGDAEERAAAAVTATYDRICRYPLARRPRRVAANVLMDAAAELRRAARVAPAPIDPSRLVAECGAALPGTEHPALELVDALSDAVATGVVSADDASLIAASRIAGTSLGEIARQRGAKLRTLQWRRQRAEAALSAH